MVSLRNSAVALAIMLPFQAHALTVTPSTDATALATSLLNPGTGVTIVSATLTGATGNGFTATGGFSDGGAIGIDEGVILTTGDVNDAVGPNDDDSTTNDLGNPGIDIPGVVSGNGNDAVRLDIEFTTDTGSLFFNYVFASEEYNEFVNSQYNDSFVFLLDGVNIALIRGTSDPVTINNVNGGNPFGTGGSNASLFNNNDLDDGGPFFDIEYDGFTDVFTATATGLISGTTYLLSMIIQDVADPFLDSAVFIEGGSFGGVDPEPPSNPIPLPGGLVLLLGALGGLGLARRRTL